MSQPDRYFVGQGLVSLAQLDVTTLLPSTGFTLLGNVSSLSLKLGLHPAQYATGGAATAARKHQGDPPGFTMDMESLTRQNLATALLGASTSTAGSTVSGEVKIAHLGRVTPLDNVNLLSLVLKNIAGTVTYTEGVDYTANLGSGSFMALVEGSITDLQSVAATYTFADYATVMAYNTAPYFYWLRFEGLNQDGTPVVVDIFKTKLFPIDSFDLIGDRVTTLEVRGRIFRDRTKSATTEGQLIRIRQVL